MANPFANISLNDALKIGGDIYDQTRRNKGEQDRISQVNQGFNLAKGEIRDFGDRALDAVTQGAAQANKSITDATARGVGAQQPFYDEGLNTLAEFRSILDNPEQILNVPGVRFQYEQGLEGVNRAMEKNNLLNSSARLNAVTEFGQGLASTALDQSLNRRIPLLQAGQGAANNISTLESTAGTNLANVATQTGRNLADINLGQGENLATLQLGQNALLSNRDLADSVRDTGLTDILTDVGGQLLGDATIGGAIDAAKGRFGSGAGTAAGGAGAALGAGIANAGALGINTAPAIAGQNLMGVTTGGGAATTAGGIGGTLGFGAGSTGTLSGAVQPGIGQSQMFGPQGAEAFGAPAGFGQTAGGGAEAGATAAARAPISPAMAAAWAGPITGITALLRGQGMGQAGAQGLGAAGGAALGAQLGAAGGPVGAGVGAIIGGLVGGIGGGKLGEKLGLSASGGGDDKPDYSLTFGANDTGLMARSPWGVFGFGHHKHLTNNSRYQAGLDFIAETDSIVDAALTPQEKVEVRKAFNDKGQVASASNEGGFNPGRMMNKFYEDRAKTLQSVLGQERFAQLKLDEIYQALGSGDQAQIQSVFGV